MTCLAGGLHAHRCDVEHIPWPSRIRVEIFSSFADNSAVSVCSLTVWIRTNLTYNLLHFLIRTAGIHKI